MSEPVDRKITKVTEQDGSFSTNESIFQIVCDVSVYQSAKNVLHSLRMKLVPKGSPSFEKTRNFLLLSQHDSAFMNPIRKIPSLEPPLPGPGGFRCPQSGGVAARRRRPRGGGNANTWPDYIHLCALSAHDRYRIVPRLFPLRTAPLRSHIYGARGYRVVLVVLGWRFGTFASFKLLHFVFSGNNKYGHQIVVGFG